MKRAITCTLPLVVVATVLGEEQVLEGRKTSDIPLHLAAAYGYVDSVEALISTGADPNRKITPHGGVTALHFALGMVRPEDFAEGFRDRIFSIDGKLTLSPKVVQHLLVAGANPNAMEYWNSYGKTPVIFSAASPLPASVDAMVALLAAGADPNLRPHHGNDPFPGSCQGSALHEAVAIGSVDKIRLLLAAGANVNALDYDDRTPLDYAIPGPVTSVLGTHGAKSGVTYLALHRAASSNFGELQDLIASGADLDRFSRGGLTPLHFAIAYCNERAVQFLLSVGSNPNAVMSESDSSCRADGTFLSPLQAAVSWSTSSVDSAFDRSGIDPIDPVGYPKLLFFRSVNESHDFYSGYSPPHSSLFPELDCDGNMVEIVRLLLAAGAR
ncbi:MAG: ankyrin repeat domain-containing protein [Chloroflexota bacterium]|nr:ankyrin repeat domain-containing protein [Chloroflexota bacterium]